MGNNSPKSKKSKQAKSIDESLEQIIEMKKSENSALRKIFDSLKKGNPGNKSK